jgi:hypothetical protein
MITKVLGPGRRGPESSEWIDLPNIWAFCPDVFRTCRSNRGQDTPGREGARSGPEQTGAWPCARIAARAQAPHGTRLSLAGKLGQRSMRQRGCPIIFSAPVVLRLVPKETPARIVPGGGRLGVAKSLSGRTSRRCSARPSSTISTARSDGVGGRKRTDTPGEEHFAQSPAQRTLAATPTPGNPGRSGPTTYIILRGQSHPPAHALSPYPL